MGEVEHGVDSNPNRVFFTPEELNSFDKEQFVQRWSKQEQYINWIESQLSAAQTVPSHQIRELEDKLRQTLSESARRESILLMRLNAKEQEMQDLIVQIQELKASQAASAVSLRSSLLDPAVNLLIQQLRKELEKAKSALEETQNELSAWKFTPDSNTGKRLMAKCRLLYQENEELGRMISSGRLAKLEGDLALQRNFSEEMKKSQSELDEFLLELDEDVEGMQSTIYFLQQQLRQTREQLAAVQKENEVYRNNSDSSIYNHAHQSQLGESSKSSVDRQYTQSNGTADHSIQSCSSPRETNSDTDEPVLKQSSSKRSVVSSQGSSALRHESEPDSNHNERRLAVDRRGESDSDETGSPATDAASEERIGEADTTDTNDVPRHQGVADGVVVRQAVADEGIEPVQQAARTSNGGGGGGSGEGSPDDGGARTMMMEPSSRPDHSPNDLVYHRADSGAAALTCHHRSSTEGAGDLVSGSGFTDDDAECRTSGFVNGVSTSDESLLRQSQSDKCQQRRKRTASQTEADDDDDVNDDDDDDEGQEASAACRPSGSQDLTTDSAGVSLRKRCRAEPESLSVTNGKDDVDDDESNS